MGLSVSREKSTSLWNVPEFSDKLNQVRNKRQAWFTYLSQTLLTRDLERDCGGR